MIPLEVSLPTLRTMQVEVEGNDALMEEVLDFANEKKIALIQLAHYQQSLSKQRCNQLNPREFQVSDMVRRKNMGSMVDPTHGKLVANWVH